MARKNEDKPKKSGRPAGRKPTYIVYARIEPQVGAALDAYIEQTRPKSNLTNVVQMAIEEFLARHWPQQPGEPPTSR